MRIDGRSTAARALAASVCLIAAASARAECPAGTNCPPPTATAPGLAAEPSPEQIALFARLVNSTEEVVRARLASDPQLPALAVAATDAYASRKSTGKTLTILGGGILIAGDLVGAAMMASASGYPAVDESGRAQYAAGLGVAVASIGVGLALGIPGVIKLAKRSPEESLARQHFRQSPPAPIVKDRAVPPPAAAGTSLLSFAF